MGSPLVQEAVRVVQVAIDLDTNHRYAEAVPKYDEALRIFARARDELAASDPVSAVTVAQKMEEYEARAKVLRSALAQNPFHSPAPAPLGLSMAAPIPVASSAAQPPAYIPPPDAGIPAYVGMPPPRGIPPPAGQLPVMAAPPPAAVPADPKMNKITKQKEQEFMGHKNKIKFIASLPRYAERLRPSEVVNVDVVVDNPTGCVVTSVKITLMRITTTFKADGTVKADTQKVKGGRFPMKEEKYEGSLEFVIPSDATPSISNQQGGGNSAFTVSYDLVVKAAVKMHKDVELVFPIVITPRL